MIWKLFWLGLFTALTAYVFQVMLLFDVGKRVYNHRPGPCKQLEGIEYGSEDLALIEPEGIAFVTSGLFYMAERPPKVTGNIFLYDFKNPDAAPLKLPINGFKELFLHTIEVFDYDREKKILNHVKTIKDEKFVRPNNVVALSEDQLIVSNDGTAQTHFLNVLEVVAFYKGGSVVYFDGKKSQWLAEGVMSANGIALDRSRKHLLVSHLNSKTIGVYKLSQDHKSMTPVASHFIGTAADNLWVDPQGGVWTGAHPVWNKAGPHFGEMDNLEIYAPSQVVHMKFSPDWQNIELTQVFADEGKLIAGSAVAVQYNGKLFIGSVCRQAVVCDNPM